MPISVTCRNCGAQLRVADELAGKVGKCPKCGNAVRIPDRDLPGHPSAVKRTMPPPDPPIRLAPPPAPETSRQKSAREPTPSIEDDPPGLFSDSSAGARNVEAERHSPITANRTCANCDRQVGKLEQMYDFRGNLVCRTCFTLLSTPIGGSVPGMIPQQVVITRQPKSRGVYIILGLLLGGLGIHNFYAGYYGSGVAQLVITLLLGQFLFPLFIVVVYLMVIVEVVSIRKDAAGVLFV